MRKTPILTLALLSAILSLAIQQIHAAAQTMDGVISDSMRGRKHMLPGKTDVQCIQQCITDKATYALVTATKVYVLIAKPQTIAPFAGKHVHIEGDLHGNKITVTSIREMRHNMQM